MSSSRNMAIIGLSIMVGIMIPIYIRETKDPIKTGILVFEPLHEKANNLGFQPSPTQTGLYSHRSWLEAVKKKMMDCTICYCTADLRVCFLHL